MVSEVENGDEDYSNDNKGSCTDGKRAETKRSILLCVRVGGIESGSVLVELGLRTIGFGRRQLLLTAAPQRVGFPATEEGNMALKKAPAGSSP
ncbi:hypothetical protein L1887_32903 [Cichorium endivia]|nr:hypothetical protein L1887_32903 [Cichorium endivia]